MVCEVESTIGVKQPDDSCRTAIVTSKHGNNCVIKYADDGSVGITNCGARNLCKPATTVHARVEVTPTQLVLAVESNNIRSKWPITVIKIYDAEHVQVKLAGLGNRIKVNVGNLKLG